MSSIVDFFYIMHLPLGMHIDQGDYEVNKDMLHADFVG